METIDWGRLAGRIGERPASLERHLGYWLRLVSNRVSGNFARALQTKHTSVAEWVTLCLVYEHPEIAPGQLARSLALTRGAISKVIDKLEAKRWIACSTMREDNRVQQITLTPHGRRALPQLAKIAEGNDREFFDCLDAGEKAALKHLLRKLANAHQLRDIPVE